MADINNQNQGLTPEEEGALNLRAKYLLQASESLEGYLQLLKEIQLKEQSIANAKRDSAKVQQSIDKINNKLLKEALTLSDKQKLVLEAQIAKKEALRDIINANVEASERDLAIQKDALSMVKRRVVVGKAILSQAKTLGKVLLSQTGYLLDQQKAVKDTELSMGLLSNQANAFRNNIYKTSLRTNAIGIDTKDLAAIQGTYSQNIGRAVQLSEEQLVAVSNLAKGTTLGAEGAAEFAANMENFGVSAQGSADLVEGMLQTSHKMGVNSSKVIKSVQKNLKLAQKYHFKGGIKGLAKMAALTTKFKIELESVAGFAEKLITPEGAIEAASKLQVLGGAWAKMGDPFELMYRSRNDIEGLTEDIINATKATARFDKASGEFKIDPMELHKLREVANVTGISFDELAKSSKEAAKFTKVKGDIKGYFSKEDKEYIASLATFDEKSGKFKITLTNKDNKTVTRNVDNMSDITSATIKTHREYKQTLEKNAKQSLTFQDTWENLTNTFKSTLLPGFEAFAGSLQEGLNSFTDWAVKEDAFNKLADFGKTVGQLAGVVVKFISKNPWLAIGGIIAGKMAMWYARGVMLGQGFNSSSKGGGMFGGKGMAKGGGIKGTAGNFGKGLKSIGARGGGVLAAGMSGYNEWSDNSGKGMGTGENVMRTGARASGAGLGAWGGAAAGAALGSFVPVIGTAIGGIVGGILGGMGGDKLGDMLGDSMGSPKFNDFISRPGTNPVSFSKSDTLIGAKKGGPIDKMLGDTNSVSAKSGKMVVDFARPMEINGRIEVTSGNQSASIDLNDPILMGELTRVIQEQLSKSISGGKMSSNPVVY